MKPLGYNPAVPACLTAVLLFCGCSHKKVVVGAPPTPGTSAQEQPAPQPTPAETPAQSQESQASPTQGTPPPEPQPTEQPQPATTEKPESAKAKAAKPHSNGKKTAADSGRNAKTVVKPNQAETASAAGQISPSLSHAEVAHDQATTEQLLQSTESTLNGIKRQLSQDEQTIVAQIHDLINQSRQASKANDLTRAYKSAMKARLLADDLAKGK
jgi:hypothetical protein